MFVQIIILDLIVSKKLDWFDEKILLNDYYDSQKLFLYNFLINNVKFKKYQKSKIII